MFSHKLAVSTISLGQHPSHAFDHKISAAAQAGYSGIELVFSDLEAYSCSNGLSKFEGAKKLKQICDELKLGILTCSSAL